MSTSNEVAAMRLALEALNKLADAAGGFSVSGVYFNEGVWEQECLNAAYDAIKALEEALAKKSDSVEPVAEPHKGEPVAWLNPNLEHKAEEAECVTMCLNDRGVPTHDGDKDLSLWGRVEQYAKPRFLEGMTTNSPQVSHEHLLAIAKVCKLIRSHTTKEIVDLITGYAQVVLNDKAVQEAFVKANAHLLYTTPQQRTWVGLTHEKRVSIIHEDENRSLLEHCEQIEARLKEKNNVSR